MEFLESVNDENGFAVVVLLFFAAVVAALAVTFILFVLSRIFGWFRGVESTDAYRGVRPSDSGYTNPLDGNWCYYSQHRINSSDEWETIHIAVGPTGYDAVLPKRSLTRRGAAGFMRG